MYFLCYMADLVELAIELIPSISAPAIAVFAIWLTFRWQDKHERGRILFAVKNEIIENAVVMKKLEEDLKVELERVKTNQYSVATFLTLHTDSWLLLKTSKFLSNIDYEKYIKIIRYYAYVMDLNSSIQTRNTHITLAMFIPTTKTLEGLDNDLKYRIEIVRKKSDDLEQVLKEL